MAQQTRAQRSSSSSGSSSSGKRSGAGPSRSGSSGASAEGSWSEKSINAVREAIEQGVMAPRNLMMLSRDRIQEVMDDAVERGRMTRDDANETVQRLVRRGRKQTDDVLQSLESLLGRTREGVDQRSDRARSAAESTAGKVGRQVRDTSDPALREADKFRRAAGVGSDFPITAYDELTAAQIKQRLSDLTPAELRKVRDYEAKHGNRKTVLSTIDRKLSE